MAQLNWEGDTIRELVTATDFCGPVCTSSGPSKHISFTHCTCHCNTSLHNMTAVQRHLCFAAWKWWTELLHSLICKMGWFFENLLVLEYSAFLSNELWNTKYIKRPLEDRRLELMLLDSQFNTLPKRLFVGGGKKSHPLPCQSSLTLTRKAWGRHDRWGMVTFRDTLHHLTSYKTVPKITCSSCNYWTLGPAGGISHSHRV